MKSKFLLAASLVATVFTAEAQNANRGFAITGDGNNDYAWMNIREIDLSTGKVVSTIFDRAQSAFSITDVQAKKILTKANVYDGTAYSATMFPTATFVAAAAYDNRTEKLFFIPMRMGQIRWMDASKKADAPSFYSIEIPGYTPSAFNEEANNITRMVIGADGSGYAITNDANHLYKFTTGKKPTVVDLGNVLDAEGNAGLSVHNKCTSWGGDMIADAYGKLYIISASKNVFEINTDTRVATLKGTITGLPSNYTANGAAVDAEGNVILSSAIAFVGYYKMNIKDLAATLITGSDVKYNASDLASGNLLFQKEADAAKAAMQQPVVFANITSESSVFPNPVSGSNFNVLLAGRLEGIYSVIISDLAGRALQNNKITFVKGQQTQQINFVNKPTTGTYLVRVLDEKGIEMLSDKLVVL